MKGIERLDKERWKLRVTPVNPATGKRVDKEKTVYAVSEKQAMLLRMEFEKEVLLDLERNLYGTSGLKTETLKEFCEYHLDNPGKPTRENVIKRDRQTFNTMIYPIIGDVRMKKLSTQHMLRWQTEVQKMKTVKKGEDYSKQSLAKAWRVLRAAMNRAGVLGRAEKNICAGMYFSPNGKNRAVKDSLSQDEFTGFLTALAKESLDVQAMVWIAMSTGMRFGEISSLRWDDVDFKNESIAINKSQDLGDVNPPKNGMARNAALLPVVADVLKAHQAKWKERSNLPGVIFPSKRGTYRNSSVLWSALRRVTKAAGINKKISAHSLRRTLIDTMRRAGVDPIIVRALVGHSTDSMRQLYSRPSIEELAEAQELAFGNLVSH